jgi:hypothetical protein
VYQHQPVSSIYFLPIRVSTFYFLPIRFWSFNACPFEFRASILAHSSFRFQFLPIRFSGFNSCPFDFRASIFCPFEFQASIFAHSIFTFSKSFYRKKIFCFKNAMFMYAHYDKQNHVKFFDVTRETTKLLKMSISRTLTRTKMYTSKIDVFTSMAQ